MRRRSPSRRAPGWTGSPTTTYARFERLNAAYREKFGFPFIIAVRRHDTHAILAAFETRLGHGVDDEIEAALAQIAEIARLRLDALATGR